MKTLTFLLSLMLLSSVAAADQQSRVSRHSPSENRIQIESVPGAARVSLTSVDRPQAYEAAPACAPPCSLNLPDGRYRLNVSDGKVWTPATRPLQLVRPLTLVPRVDSALGFRILGGVISVLGLGGGTALMATATAGAPAQPTNVLQLVLGGVAVAAGLGGGLPLLFMQDTVHVQAFVPGAKLPK